MQRSRNRGALALRALLLFVGWVMPVASFAAAFPAPDFVSGSPRAPSAAAVPSPASDFSISGFDVGLAGPMQSVRADGLLAFGLPGHASTILIATAAIPAASHDPERAVRHPDVRLYPTG